MVFQDFFKIKIVFKNESGWQKRMMISIGFKNYVNLDRIVSIIAPNSKPIKNMINSAREKGKLVDATMGKKTKSVIVTNSDHIVLSANLPDTIVNRVEALSNKLMLDESE